MKSSWGDVRGCGILVGAWGVWGGGGEGEGEGVFVVEGDGKGKERGVRRTITHGLGQFLAVGFDLVDL